MSSYKNIYFDLDRTLWDFDTNTTATLLEIVKHFNLEKTIPNSDDFIENYNEINNGLWEEYRAGSIKKSELRIVRFKKLFDRYDVKDDVLVSQINRFFLNESPTKKALIPGAEDLLKYLSEKYSIYIISNGFYDVQLTKVISSGISKYISRVFTSDRLGVAKPAKEIFIYSLTTVNARKTESIVIGDDENNDIRGAINAGIDQIYFNPNRYPLTTTPTHEVAALAEIKKIL